jgi:hypothetical protein
MSDTIQTLPDVDGPLTRAEFCKLERISLSTYFKIRRAGHGPAEEHFPGMSLVRITAKARREWHERNAAWNQSKAAKTEELRRSELARAAGMKAAKSPLHVSKRKVSAK